MLEMSAVETLIVWENLDYWRVTLKDPTKEDSVLVQYVRKEFLTQETKTYKDKKSGVEYQVVQLAPLNEW